MQTRQSESWSLTQGLNGIPMALEAASMTTAAYVIPRNGYDVLELTVLQRTRSCQFMRNNNAQLYQI